jgi:polyphosphate kinase
MAKMNSLGDPQVIDALYEASQAGVPIQLNVRGICCLRPRVPGLSDNVRVVSIVDRFLEHSRILYFYHGGDERTFISSADWMPRNLDRRIELLVPVEDTAARRRLIGILETCFRDTVKAREIRPDGQYERILPPDGGEAVRSQEALYRQACDRATRSLRSQVTVFEPHQSASGR